MKSVMQVAALGERNLGLVAVLVLLCLPLFVEDWQLFDFSRYFAYMMLAISLAWVWGHCGMLSLGQAVFFGLGAYAMSVVTLGKLPGLPDLNSFWVGMLFAAALAGAAAALIGAVLFTAKGLSGAFFGIIMLAIAFIVERIAINWNYLGGLNGLMNVPGVRLSINDGDEMFDPYFVYFAGLGLLVALAGALIWASRSPWGRAMAAIRNNESRAQALGLNLAREKTRAFVVGAVVAGIGGAFFVTQFNFASPPLIGFALSAEVLIWVAVGGRTSVVAAALGALTVRLAESTFSSTFGDAWLLVLGSAFLFTVVALPRGLFGEIIPFLGGKKNHN